MKAYIHTTLLLALSMSFPCAQAASESKSNFRPLKPVTLVVPYSAGGGTDVIARLFAKNLGDLWGQSVIVDNRTGANGSIGSAYVANAKPDGTTLLVVVSSITINPYVMNKLPYETRTAFAPITPLAYSVVVLAGSPKLVASDMRSFVVQAKQYPGKFSFASSEPATRLTAERIFEAGAIKLTHIPYRGASSWMSDLVAGEIDVGVASITSVQPFLKDGRIKILAVAGERRHELLPNVPTFREQGISGQETHSWYGLFAPAGTPSSTIRAIHADVRKVLMSTEVQTRIGTLGALPGGDDPEKFTARFQADLRENAELTQRLGMKPE